MSAAGPAGALYAFGGAWALTKRPRGEAGIRRAFCRTRELPFRGRARGAAPGVEVAGTVLVGPGRNGAWRPRSAGLKRRRAPAWAEQAFEARAPLRLERFADLRYAGQSHRDHSAPFGLRDDARSLRGAPSSYGHARAEAPDRGFDARVRASLPRRARPQEPQRLATVTVPVTRGGRGS